VLAGPKYCRARPGWSKILSCPRGLLPRPPWLVHVRVGWSKIEK
jgi:hypothetical protein